MSSGASEWREKATSLLSCSSLKLKQAGQSAGSSFSDAAGRARVAIKSKWTLLQQSRQEQSAQSAGDSMQERILSAAASTGTLLKRSISQTKDKVATGKVIVEEVAKKTAQRSRSMFTNLERWQRGVTSNDVFGVPIETVVRRQKSTRPIPYVLIRCADFIVMSGLATEFIFKIEGDKRVIQALVSLFNEDWNAPLPEGASPIDVAALIKVYLWSLPEPLIPVYMYNDIKSAKGNVNQLRSILKRLPNVNHATLELITALLQKISQTYILNKMDARSLAIELAPTMFWNENDKIASLNGLLLPLQHGGRFLGLGPPLHDSERSSRMQTIENGFYRNNKNGNSINEIDDLFDDNMDVESQIPLDDGTQAVDYVVVDTIQCLIEQHSIVFIDVEETIW
eukprot:TRINITY_DN15116_c0_g1_i1.p1 TRINITY_DN15116_c0_g1~~TRINITY_DN15116_c0_g1_i1.p1  ORF type:complete len:396 (+),score=85.92 TRINITY_DN15116_c0_g1_i1:622-1809(+)